jgi:hypothetical protein
MPSSRRRKLPPYPSQLMKNSNKYLLAALLVLLTSLTAYNMALRTEYRKGTYKDPLRDFTTLQFQDFTEVTVPAASVVRVKIVSGPFKVRVSPQASKYVQVRQQGSQLSITAAFPEGEEFLGHSEAVVISCPQLAVLTTDAIYQLKGQPHVDKNQGYPMSKGIVVQGFTQDSLTLRQDKASRIELAGNHLGSLRATAGATPGSHATLQINPDNRIGAASLAIERQSELILNNVAIARLHYHFADSAKATLTGAALGSFAK